MILLTHSGKRGPGRSKQGLGHPRLPHPSLGWVFRIPRASNSPHNENRVVWATLYNRVGVVKAHVECPKFARLSKRR